MKSKQMNLTEQFSNVEKKILQEMNISQITTRIPYLTAGSFPKLGLFTALRFLEWVSNHPEGVISLPTGKTPEFFIKFTQHLLNNWNEKQVIEIREKYDLTGKKPELKALRFIQIDEFYPIDPKQKNSFFNYVENFYIKRFGLNPQNALLINSESIPLFKGKHYKEVFLNNNVDISLRHRDAKNELEELQQKSIFKIDQWCMEYENKIRNMGGIGFFLGGIGPDGHIAFNVRGSDHYSTTRLTPTNFETEAVSSGDLGGIEVSRGRPVITIGLDTITYNPEAVAIIFAAGEAKAQVVKDALESKKSVQYPASVLQKLPNARFFLTESAAVLLEDFVLYSLKEQKWNDSKTDKIVIDLSQRLNTFGTRLKTNDLQKDKLGQFIPHINDQTVPSVIKRTQEKIRQGMKRTSQQRYLHTGPHHDDISLGILPYVAHQTRGDNNTFDFAVLTSGFTAVTNKFVIDYLKKTQELIIKKRIEMLYFPDFFQSGFKEKRDKDIYHYLINVATKLKEKQSRAFCHRLVYILCEVYQLKNIEELNTCIQEVIDTLENSYDGEKNPPNIQTLKGMIREFEEELVWAHYGITLENIHHLRLGFYTGDIFTEQPNKQRDVLPFLELLRKVKPTVVSLALDPEGSGPDTHYKVLQVIAEAIRLYSKEADTKQLKVHGYRNVWYRFHPSDANILVPVSLNSLASLDESFTQCYLSQVNASFPSYLLDGKFSTLTQKIWTEQLQQIHLLLGKDYFYLNENPRLRNAHGMLYFKEMSVDEFLSHARNLEKSVEGVDLNSSSTI